MSRFCRMPVLNKQSASSFRNYMRYFLQKGLMQFPCWLRVHPREAIVVVTVVGFRITLFVMVDRWTVSICIYNSTATLMNELLFLCCWLFWNTIIFHKYILTGSVSEWIPLWTAMLGFDARVGPLMVPVSPLRGYVHCLRILFTLKNIDFNQVNLSRYLIELIST